VGKLGRLASCEGIRLFDVFFVEAAASKIAAGKAKNGFFLFHIFELTRAVLRQ
jgi:hypothetical protein